MSENIGLEVVEEELEFPRGAASDSKRASRRKNFAPGAVGVSRVELTPAFESGIDPGSGLFVSIELPGNREDQELLEVLESEVEDRGTTIEFNYMAHLDFSSQPHWLRRMGKAVQNGDAILIFYVVLEPAAEDSDVQCHPIGMACVDLGEVFHAKLNPKDKELPLCVR